MQWVRLVEPLFGHAEIHWLRFIAPQEDTTHKIHEHHYHYWSQYTDAHVLINSVRPHSIIIMDNLAPLTQAVLFAAKQKQIPVYYLQHGMYGTYRDYTTMHARLRRDESKREAMVAIKREAQFSTLTFIRQTLGIRLFHPGTLAYLLFSRLWGEKKAAYYIKDALRVPNAYLCYDTANATIHKELDGIEDDKIIIVGNPELEKVMAEYNKAIPYHEEDYWLLIDQPLSGGDLGEAWVDRALHLAIYLHLADQAATQGRRLLVKLHPGNYGWPDLLSHPNINWIEDMPDMAGLIKGSAHCIGFFSSLLLPCIELKPVSLIRLFNLSFYERFSDRENVQVVDDWESALEVPASPEPGIKYNGNYARALFAACLPND